MNEDLNVPVEESPPPELNEAVSLPEAIAAVERAQPPVTIEAMILRAIDKGVSVDTMERLLVMRRELKGEMAKAAFDESMAKFQRSCPPIRKTKKVYERNSNKVRYAYAPLESIVEQVKDLVAAHGFSFSVDAQVEPLGDRSWVTALCKVTHSAGHSQVSQFKVPIDPDAYMNEAQKFASAFTFTKRYAFCAAFGIMTADEDDDSVGTGEPKEGGRPLKAPGSTAAPVPTKVSVPGPIVRPSATEAHKKRLIEILNDQASLAPDFLSVTKEYMEKVGGLLPTESLEDLPLTFVPVSKEQLDALIKAIDDFGAGEEAKLPYEQNPASVLAKGKVEQKAPVESNNAQKQSWYGIIVPIPRKGQTRDEYLKNPDTIGSLYEARHGTDDLAQEARQRLYGFLHNYEPKGWVKRDGTQMPPSQGDKKFREALDVFGEWFDKHHADEKL